MTMPCKTVANQHQARRTLTPEKRPNYEKNGAAQAVSVFSIPKNLLFRYSVLRKSLLIGRRKKASENSVLMDKVAGRPTIVGIKMEVKAIVAYLMTSKICGLVLVQLRALCNFVLGETTAILTFTLSSHNFEFPFQQSKIHVLVIHLPGLLGVKISISYSLHDFPGHSLLRSVGTSSEWSGRSFGSV